MRFTADNSCRPMAHLSLSPGESRKNNHEKAKDPGQQETAFPYV
jgi:hypothetical protein